MDLSTVPYGRVRKTYVAPFELGRPSWLEVPGSTGAVMPSTAGFYQVSGSPAVLRTTFDLTLGAYERVALFADGLHVADADMSLGLSLKDDGAPSRGVSIWSPLGANASTYRAFASGQPDTSVPYYWGGVEGPRRRNLGLVVRPQRREVLLVMDDQVIWSRHEPNLVLGDVRAVIDGGGAGGCSIRLAQFRLELQHN